MKSGAVSNNSKLDSADHRLGRIEELEHEQVQHVHEGADRLLISLLFVQWVAVVVVALVFTPLTWIGTHYTAHLHLWVAIGGGALLSVPPWLIARAAPGTLSTRVVLAITQAGWSALFIHMSGGRIETHFHVFVSLVVLSWYLDIRVLLVATAGVAIDHAVRGIFWPQSVFGIIAEAPYRWIEHAAWVLLEVGFLYCIIRQNLRGIRESAKSRARYEESAETRIAESEAALNQFIETAPFFVGELELRADEIYFVSGNRAAVDFFGLEAGTKSRFVPQESSLWRKGLEDAINKRGSSEFPILARSAPEVCWLSVTIGLLPGREGVHRFCFIAHDITERMVLISELEASKIEAESANRAKSEFLMNMSHEVRTPLNGIAAAADILTDEDSTPEERVEFGSMISKNTRKLTDILEDIFTLSSVGDEAVSVARHPFSVPQLLEELSEEFRDEARAKGVDLRVDVASGVVATSDENLVRRALRNLVANAVRFTERGSVDLSAIFDEESLTLVVQDTGVGISADQLQSVFEAFTQADGSLTRTHGGMGVGLTVTDCLAKALGGRVEVESHPGEGSCFRLIVPARVSIEKVL